MIKFIKTDEIVEIQDPSTEIMVVKEGDLFQVIGAFSAFLRGCGYVFDKLDVDLGLGSLTISFDEIVAAFVGALILLAVLSFLQKRR